MSLPIPAAAVPRTAISQATAVEQSRAVAEVQAAVVVAQQCPRDMGRALAEMRDVTSRTALANRAFYRVPNRGSGPSVHLARELARIWGNVDYGVKELHRDDVAGTSEILAYAWDVQTNTRSTRTFIVPHQRMKGGKREDLVDLADVYLNNQNIGARAVRECVFTVLPTWYVDEAEAICQRTLVNGDGEPLESRVTKMVTAFHNLGVTVPQIEAKLKRQRSAWEAGDVATMTVCFQSIQRGEITVEEEFGTAAPVVSASTFSQAAAQAATPQTDGGEGTPAETSVAEGVAGSSPASNTSPPSPEPAAPAAEPTPVAEPKITQKQQSRLFQLFKARGIPEHQQRAFLEWKLGRLVTSRTALTPQEYETTTDHLEQMPDQAPPAMTARDKVWAEFTAEAGKHGSTDADLKMMTLESLGVPWDNVTAEQLQAALDTLRARAAAEAGEQS